MLMDSPRRIFPCWAVVRWKPKVLSGTAGRPSCGSDCGATATTVQSSSSSVRKSVSGSSWKWWERINDPSMPFWKSNSMREVRAVCASGRTWLLVIASTGEARKPVPKPRCWTRSRMWILPTLRATVTPSSRKAMPKRLLWPMNRSSRTDRPISASETVAPADSTPRVVWMMGCCNKCSERSRRRSGSSTARRLPSWVWAALIFVVMLERGCSRVWNRSMVASIIRSGMDMSFTPGIRPRTVLGAAHFGVAIAAGRGRVRRRRRRRARVADGWSG